MRNYGAWSCYDVLYGLLELPWDVLMVDVAHVCQVLVRAGLLRATRSGLYSLSADVTRAQLEAVVLLWQA